MRNSDTPAGFKRRFLMPYRKMKNSQRNCLTSSNMATAWHHLTCSTVARKGLEEHRSASIRNSETPQQDKPCQNSPPYRTGMEWRRRWPHGLGPKHPKHGFFGALPLGQRGRRITTIIILWLLLLFVLLWSVIIYLFIHVFRCFLLESHK